MPAESLEPIELSTQIPTEADQQHVCTGVGLEGPRPSIIRVLHVINGEHYSGAERVQDLLGQHLPSFGYEAAFACVKPGRFAERRQDHNSTIYDLPMTSRIDLRVARELREIIREEDYQLVHAHTPRSALVGRLAAWLAKVPMVYHVHSPTSLDTTDGWRNHWNNWSERASLYRISRLIAVSNSLGRHMRLQGYRSELISVVPNGVPTSTLRRESKRPSGTWTIGTVALFRPRKGLEVLLESIALMKQNGVSVRLRAVGPFETPDYEAEVQWHVERLGVRQNIDWVGFTQNVTEEFAQMDLFVLPSLFGEGLPMVVLEAMAAGVPVIGTRVEGVPEAIDDGVNGVIANPSDPADLAHSMMRVIEGELDWCVLQDRAIKTHAEHFSAELMAHGVAAVYDEVLGATRVK
ncbi:MAG: glycosyltransferase [Planctomycetaceae bacterium]|nr:glycosyltransferase [Planctomycetales bacterium]MCB9923999.1 glycosyltransferase [Planctomycetaceae bacterium]